MISNNHDKADNEFIEHTQENAYKVTILYDKVSEAIEANLVSVQ